MYNDSTGRWAVGPRSWSCKGMAAPGMEVQPWHPWPHTNLLPPQGPLQQMGMKKTTPTLSPFGSSESRATAAMGRARVQRSHWQNLALVLSPAATGRVTKRYQVGHNHFHCPTKNFSCVQCPFQRGIQDICYFNYHQIWIFHLSDCDKLLPPIIRHNSPSTSKQCRWWGNQAHSYLGTC